MSTYRGIDLLFSDYGVNVEDHQTLATEAVREGPEALQGIHIRCGAVHHPRAALSWSASWAGVAGDEDDTSGADHPHLLAAACPEYKGSITAGVAGQLHKFGQDLATLFLGRLTETGCQFSDNRMSFAHCKPHEDLLQSARKVRFLLHIWNRNLHEATTPFRIEIC
jgi:hypothetical protein